MRRAFNVIVPTACPHCRTELLLTLEMFHEERTIRCSLCGTTIRLRPEALSVPPVRQDAEAPGFFAEP